jgi:hypothetical protein
MIPKLRSFPVQRCDGVGQPVRAVELELPFLAVAIGKGDLISGLIVGPR